MALSAQIGYIVPTIVQRLGLSHEYMGVSFSQVFTFKFNTVSKLSQIVFFCTELTSVNECE